MQWLAKLAKHFMELGINLSSLLEDVNNHVSRQDEQR